MQIIPVIIIKAVVLKVIRPINYYYHYYYYYDYYYYYYYYLRVV